MRHIRMAMTKKMTTAKIMINIQSASPSSTFSEITPHAILFPAFPTLSPVDDRSSSPVLLRIWKYIQIVFIETVSFGLIFFNERKLSMVQSFLICFYLPSWITRVRPRMDVSPSYNVGRGDLSRIMSTTATPFSSASMLPRSPIWYPIDRWINFNM